MLTQASDFFLVVFANGGVRSGDESGGAIFFFQERKESSPVRKILNG